MRIRIATPLPTAGRLVAALACAAMLLTPAAAGGATIRVTTTGDELDANAGACSLREAIWSANNDGVLRAPGCAAGGGADRIKVPRGEYDLAIAGSGEQGNGAGDLDVTAPVTIERRGGGSAIVDGNGLDRVLEVNAPGASAVVVSGLIIRGGHAVGPPDVTSAGAGGGVLATRGALTVTDSTLSENVADSWGGGIETRFGATTSLVNTTVSGNRAKHDGGGIDNTGGTVSLLNVTVTENVADAQPLPVPPGGVSPGGGGIANVDGTLTMRSTVVAGNSERRGQTPDCFSFSSGTLASQGQTLVGNPSGCAYASDPGDVTGVDPRLGPLADNGGPTSTHAILEGSPALGTGSGCARNDQRGVPRAAGGACDIGAYELVRCHGLVANRVGTNRADRLRGTAAADAFLMLGGRDRAFGLGGGDAFCAGGGHDRAIGGRGRDRLYGDSGKDILTGGAGKDRLVGGGGRDKLRGGRGRDRLRGAGSRDTCNGGPGGADTASGCEREKKIP